MSRRALLRSCAIALVLALTESAAAWAKYRGTDMWGNLMPDTGEGDLVGRYPLSHYMLDYHVDVGITKPDGIPPLVAQFTASWAFFIAVLLMRVVVAIFQWAYSVDLVTGDGGLLARAEPLSQSYYGEYVKPFMVTAMIMFGCWLLYKASRHEHKDTGGAIVRVLVLTAVSVAVVYHPQETIGRAYSMVDGLSTSIVAHGGDTNDAADVVFETFVYRPWVVIEFGGLQTCTSKTERDGDGFPRPIKSTSSGPKVCHSALKKGADGHGDYARRFLRYAPGTDERKAEYDALREGSAPDTPQFADVTIDRTDAPAVDVMQAQGATQRVAFVGLMVACMIFGCLLIALVSVAALFVQIAITLLFVVGAFAVLAAIYPPAHGLYARWASLLGKALIGKLVYSLVLAIPLSTSAFLLVVGGTSGYFIAFALQALLFGGVFVMRKKIVDRVTSSRAAERYSSSENAVVSGAAGAATASFESVSGGAKTFASTMREGWSAGHGAPQGDDDEHAPDSSSPPASAGREYSPPGPPAEASSSPEHEGDHEFARARADRSGSSETMEDDTDDGAAGARGGQDMPTRSFATDLASARAAQYDEEYRSERGSPPRPPDPPPAASRPTPVLRGLASASTFERDLEQERHEQDLSRRE